MKTRVIILLGLIFVNLAFSDFNFSYPGCQNVTSSDFEMVHLFQKAPTDNSILANADLDQPSQIELVPVMQGDSVTHVNVYITERKTGKVKFYDALNKTLTVAATIQINNGSDGGITGIALDPDFNTNRYMYLMMSRDVPERKGMRLYRYKVKNDHTIDLSTEFFMYEAELPGLFHAGGPMDFDKDGNLYITVGNNSADLNTNNFSHVSDTDIGPSDQAAGSNTASHRGGVLKLKIDHNAPNGYTVPAGNFGEYWADHFESQGRTALAAEYRDPAQVIPELYVKGIRSTFSLTVDQKTGYMTWGEVGPWLVLDSSRLGAGPHETEEFNLVKHPTFAGYPYYSGKLITPGHQNTKAAPMNTATFAHGVDELPPAEDPFFVYGGTNANHGGGVLSITGPIYRYDHSIKSANKFPPHFEGKWFVVENYHNWVQIFTMDEAVTNVTQRDTAFENMNFYKPIDFHQGPDGALYILNAAAQYGTVAQTGLARIDYTGPSCAAPLLVKNDEPTPSISLFGNILKIDAPGVLEVSTYSLQGEKLDLFRNDSDNWILQGEKSLTLNKLLLIKIKTETGVFIRKLSFVK